MAATRQAAHDRRALPGAFVAAACGMAAWVVGAGVSAPTIAVSAGVGCLVLCAAAGAVARASAPARAGFAAGLGWLAIPATLLAWAVLESPVLVDPSPLCGNGITFLALLVVPVAVLLSLALALLGAALAPRAPLRRAARALVWPSLAATLFCAAWASTGTGPNRTHTSRRCRWSR